MPSTQAVVTKSITVIDPLGETWDVAPFDNNGKVIPEQYLEVDMSVGDLTLNLPNLAIFGGVYGTKIFVNIITGGLNTLSFVPAALTQKIGSQVGAVSGPGATGFGFVFQPVSATEWSINITL
jgi:hypothetical protein